MGRNRFVEVGSGATYTWASNHKEEESFIRSRHLEELVPLAAGWKPRIEPVRQQGSTGPLIMRLRGQAATADMNAQMHAFWETCFTRTIYFYHWDGSVYEVILNSYEPTRKYVIRTARGEKYLWDFTMELEVIRSVTVT